jgi:hypothetical protein
MFVPILECAPTGKILGVNRQRLGFKPFWLLTDSPANSVTIPAASVIGPVPMTVSGNGPAQIVSLAHKKTGVCLVLLEVNDGQNVLALMNSPVHIDTIFGTGLNPYYLPASIVVEENKPLSVTFTDLSLSANEAMICCRTHRYLNPQADPLRTISAELERVKQRIMGTYFYTFQGGRVVLGAGASTEVAITLDKERHFQWFTLSGVSTGTYTLDIRDGLTGESVFDAPEGVSYQLPNTLVVGSASFPWRLRSPRLFQKANKIVVRLTDTSAAPNTIYLTFGGRFITAQL